jgi:hypothetical protein
MRFTVNRRPAARAPGAVPRPTRTEVNQALCSVIENRVMQLSTCLAWFVLSLGCLPRSRPFAFADGPVDGAAAQPRSVVRASLLDPVRGATDRSSNGSSTTHCL